MHKLGDQWTEIIDGQEHMVKAVETTVHPPCGLCMYSHGYQCTYPSELGECDKYAIKDLGILKDGLLPCPFCGEYPEVKLLSPRIQTYLVMHDCEWVKTSRTCTEGRQEAIEAWNRRV